MRRAAGRAREKRGGAVGREGLPLFPRAPRGKRVRVRGIRIREACLSDAAAIAAVMRASIRRLARGFYSPRQIAAWSSLPPLYHAWAMTAGGEAYVVADRHGRIVGYAARRRREVTAVFVRPPYARRGVGAALLSRIEADARPRQIPALFVRASLPAISFYEKMGFGEARRIRVSLPGGVRLPARRLVKSLV